MKRNYFYKKSSRSNTVRKNAFWTEVDGVKYLVSYETIVASITDNRLHRHWNDYSVTTMNHVNSFSRLFNVEGVSKHEWESMDVEKIDYKVASEIENIIVPVRTTYY
jgi:hypothetical protein